MRFDDHFRAVLYLCSKKNTTVISKIYKFGGASVKDANAVRNMKDIIDARKNQDIMLVVSAMGKTTNMIEEVLKSFRANDGNLGIEALSQITDYHEKILLDLFENNEKHPVFDSVSNLFLDLYLKLKETGLAYDYQYDQTVCFGELLSTTIIAEYFNECGIPTRWLDARKYVLTDYNFRAANPDWDETRIRIKKLEDEHIRGLICLTQGFLGSTADGKHGTTLGREGSDFTAAIFANCLDAEQVVIWKDVDGLLNADPKRFEKTVKIPHITYSEAIELAFYGATIIHPKTIKPLQNKNIKLMVQSFIYPDHSPTIIDGTHDDIPPIPSFIVKDNQVLVSVSPRDYSFMNEHNLQILFGICDQLNIHTNMIQTSALTLSICFDFDQNKVENLIQSIGQEFKVKYNKNLQLFTIRHYQPMIEKEYVGSRKVFVKQSSRSTLQLVLGEE
jgi:aspartate kinase